MSSITSFDRLLTMLGMFCRDELRREGLGVVLHETADNDREYLARHNVSPEWWSGLSGRGRFDELAVRVRDYPGPLPANVQENRAVFDELKRELKLIELHSERPEPEIWQKIDLLRSRLQDNLIDCELLPTDGLAKFEAATVEEPKPKKGVGKKRSTTGGDAKVKLIAALSLHHKYELNGICFSCLNHDPIGNNELAKLARVDKSTASLFFKNSFGGKGYSRYRQYCRLDRMPFILARLRGELPPLADLELFKNAHKAGLEQGEAE